jgi:dTDP-4-amino-4,6-dideoxygalactose transaminase
LPPPDGSASGAPPWPNAESAARRNLALPLYPHLTDLQVEHIADTVCAFVHTFGSRDE